MSEILVTISLDPAAALLYEQIAAHSGNSLEQVLADALFKLAGELALEALSDSQYRDFRKTPPVS